MRQVEGGAPVQVLRAEDIRGRWPAWLADGQRLLFVSPRGIEMVSALGGTPRLLVAGPHLDRGVTVAPDGQTFAYVSHDSLLAAPLNGGPARLVTHGYEMHSPAWSPDGRWIAFVQGDLQYISRPDLGNLAQSSIWLAPSERRRRASRHGRALDARESRVDLGAVAAVRVRCGRGRDAYQLSLAADGHREGEPVRITTGLSPHGITVSQGRHPPGVFGVHRDVERLVAAVPADGRGLGVHRGAGDAGQPDHREPRRLERRAMARLQHRARGTSQVYRTRLDAKEAEPQQVTSDTSSSYWVAWSPDAKEIAFHRFRGERRQVFVAPVEGGVPVAVTDGSEDERSPEWSPDGRQLLLLANWGTRGALHVVRRTADGRWSKPRALPIVLGADTIAAGIADWSPDGRWIACGCGEGGIVIAPVDGGPARRLSSPFSTAGWAFPQWSADGRTMYHLTEDWGRVVAVVAVPVDGSPGQAPRTVVRFDDPARPWHRFGFRVRGGRIFMTLGNRESDVGVADIEPK